MPYDQENNEHSDNGYESRCQVDYNEIHDVIEHEDVILDSQVDYIYKTQTEESQLIFEKFQEACTWSAKNGGKSFTRTIDGYYFTPLSIEDSERNASICSTTRIYG